MLNEKLLSKECKKYNPLAQKELYEKYSEIIMALCYRYTGNLIIAEDLMQESLIKVFTKINKFKWINEGSFDAWIKKIAINSCLTHLEKNKMKKEILIGDKEDELIGKLGNDDLENNEIDLHNINNAKIDMNIINNANLSEEDMLGALTQIPEPFRNVFNLHVIEGIKHEEIANMLKINIKTSKTRLYRARKLLKKIIYDMSLEKININ